MDQQAKKSVNTRLWEEDSLKQMVRISTINLEKFMQYRITKVNTVKELTKETRKQDGKGGLALKTFDAAKEKFTAALPGACPLTIINHCKEDNPYKLR